MLIILSLYLSFLLRFDFSLPEKYFHLLLYSTPLFVIVKIVFLYIFGLYHIIWRYVGLLEFVNIFKAIFLSEILLFFSIKYVFSVFSFLTGFPRSIFLIDLYISVILISGIRILKRVYLEIVTSSPNKAGKRTLIIGAGNVGEMVIRDIKKRKSKLYSPCCFLDDDPSKIGAKIYDIPIVGTIDNLEEVIKCYRIEVIIIAISNINHKKLREIYEKARRMGVKEIKIVPKIYSLTQPHIETMRLEDIKIEDLLKREEISIEKEKIKKFLKGRKVLITGAGGSIGSELAKQVASFEPKQLILLDIDETELHNLKLKLEELFPNISTRFKFIVGDITNESKIKFIFEKYRPEIVFHAAAYKHVPMMEENPEEAVRVNIFGTYYVAQAAVKTKVRKFIMISTDKAVNPTSIMGATKRVAEYICKALNNQNTEFVSVRFGNVLGSRGSVLPIFLEQIKRGGPVTVTHKDMKRYFMTISEAVALVLQASVIGKGGDVMVLDMGKPIRIVELAENLIKMHGLEPYKDIEIKFIGLRPGEKLFEELLTAEEGTVATYHNRIFKVKNIKEGTINLKSLLEEFRKVLEIKNKENLYEEIIKLLKKYVRSFQPWKNSK